MFLRQVTNLTGVTKFPGRPVEEFVLDRVSVPSPIAIDILMERNGEGQSSHVLVFCVNFEMLKIIPFTLCHRDCG